MTVLGAGMALYPNEEYLGLCRRIIEEDAEFFEITTETLWQIHHDGQLSYSPWADLIGAIKHHSGRPFVAHGLGLSPGTADTAADEPRLQRWLEQIKRDQDRFEYLWYTEHLGWMETDGLVAHLPLQLPPNSESVQTVARRLCRLQPIIPAVGFENQVSYFSFTDVREEAAFWNEICNAGDLWLLLDLHNVWTQCVNYGVAVDEYLADLDLSRVIEIHLSGGSHSEPGWLPEGRVMRLDSHDGPVPEEVWQAFRQLRPQCPNLRGVILERLDGTISPDDVPQIRAEFQRAKQIFWES